MRTLLKVNMCTKTANELARRGQLGPTIKSILDDLNPEASYFTDDKGERTGFIVFALKEPSQIAAVAEPGFRALNARVSFRPAMIADDLAKAASGIERAAKKFGATAAHA